MVCEDEVMGLLLADFDSFAALTEKHLIQLRLAAQLIKIAIEKEFLQLQVTNLQSEMSEKNKTNTSGLLQNEQLIDWLVEREIDRTKRHGASFAVLSILIDNLAHIITQYGTEVAEQAIVEFSDALNHIVRSCDFLARREGNKFICVSFEQNKVGAYVLAEKLRHRVKGSILIINNYRITATISIGVSLWPDGDKIKASELIERSDDALKRAAERGNRVRVWKQEEI